MATLYPKIAIEFFKYRACLLRLLALASALPSTLLDRAWEGSLTVKSRWETLSGVDCVSPASFGPLLPKFLNQAMSEQDSGYPHHNYGQSAGDEECLSEHHAFEVSNHILTPLHESHRRKR